MIKIKFKNRHDELKYFMLIKAISELLNIPVRYAECISDLDDTDKRTYKEDE